MKRTLTAGLVALGILSACGTTPPEPAPGSPPDQTEARKAWGAAKETQARKYTVALHTEPDPPAMSELFVLVATVTDKEGQPVDKAKVRLNARMPQHDHGMMTDPIPDPGTCEGTDCRWPGGIYRSQGFKFHMGGEWTVTVEVDGPMGFDNTSFIYPMR